MCLLSFSSFLVDESLGAVEDAPDVSYEKCMFLHGIAGSILLGIFLHGIASILSTTTRLHQRNVVRPSLKHLPSHLVVERFSGFRQGLFGLGKEVPPELEIYRS